MSPLRIAAKRAAKRQVRVILIAIVGAVLFIALNAGIARYQDRVGQIDTARSVGRYP